MPDKDQILVVDDALDTLEVLVRNLQACNYEVYTAQNVPDAVKILESEPLDLVITDYKMPKVSGLDLIRHVRSNFPDVEIMMITGYATIQGAVDAMKSGADAYLYKPFTDEELISTVKQSLEKLYAKRMQRYTLPKAGKAKGLIGESPSMQAVFRSIHKAALIHATVLISGESGTGKELVARAIHYQSDRSRRAFVPVNCGGIPESLLESELFGHVKGAFTGAIESRAGFFQTADGGSIFLDEISETTLAMQVKLLRVLQEKEIYMVGSSQSRKIDVRIIAATNKDLQTLVKKDVFREDLFFRLNVIGIEVPALRARNDDILLLINHFIKKYSAEYGKEQKVFSDDALKILRDYFWPGNVRELENLVQRLVVMTDGDVVEPCDLPKHMRYFAPRCLDLNRSLAEIEADHIKMVMFRVKGNKSKASKILGIDRKTLREKLKHFSIDI